MPWPGYTEESHPELFGLAAMPPPVTEEKPGQLSASQVHQFFEEGFIILTEFFTNQELEACKEAINGEVAELAQRLYDNGKIKDTYSSYGFDERMIYIERDFPGANILLHKKGYMPQAIRNLWSNERLLNCVEQLLGPNIAGHPVWNLRTKTPFNEATTVPWHQDVAYTDNDSYKVLIPTAWIPLLDAEEKNGCMQMMRRGHKSGRVGMHQCCSGGSHYVMITEEEMERSLGVNAKSDIVTCPVPYRGLLLFNNIIPHRSLDNMSTTMRWSLDLRWQQPDKPYGFNGLKEGIVFRKAGEPTYRPDWDAWLSLPPREKMYRKKILAKDDPFDTTIIGYWMEKWELVNTNAHTKKYKEQQQA